MTNPQSWAIKPTNKDWGDRFEAIKTRPGVTLGK